MRFSLPVAALLGLTAVLSPAAEPLSLTVPVTAEVSRARMAIEPPAEPLIAGALSLLEVSGVASGDRPTAWASEPRGESRLLGFARWGEKAFLVFEPATEGRHFLALVVRGELLTALVEVGEDPGPPPPPPPPPPPKPGPRWVIVVEETDDRDDNPTPTGAIVESLKLRQYLTENGHKLRAADKDQPAEWLPPYLDQIARAGVALPAVIIVDGDGDTPGKLFFVGPLPDSVDKVIALLKEHGG